MPHLPAAAVVQAQLDAYNAKDIDGLLLTYWPDAEQYELHGQLLAKGRPQMRERFLARFAEPDLHTRLLSRTVIENIVVDHEVVTRNLAEGVATVELLSCTRSRTGESGKRLSRPVKRHGSIPHDKWREPGSSAAQGRG